MSSMKQTMLKRVQAIFEFIEKQEKPFHKSSLKEIGFNPKSAEKWLDLIEYIQKQPKIRLIKTETNVIVEKVDK